MVENNVEMLLYNDVFTTIQVQVGYSIDWTKAVIYFIESVLSKKQLLHMILLGCTTNFEKLWKIGLKITFYLRPRSCCREHDGHFHTLS